MQCGWFVNIQEKASYHLPSQWEDTDVFCAGSSDLKSFGTFKLLIRNLDDLSIQSAGHMWDNFKLFVEKSSNHNITFHHRAVRNEWHLLHSVVGMSAINKSQPGIRSSSERGFCKYYIIHLLTLLSSCRFGRVTYFQTSLIFPLSIPSTPWCAGSFLLQYIFIT